MAPPNKSTSRESKEMSKGIVFCFLIFFLTSTFSARINFPCLGWHSKSSQDQLHQMCKRWRFYLSQQLFRGVNISEAEQKTSFQCNLAKNGTKHYSKCSKICSHLLLTLYLTHRPCKIMKEVVWGRAGKQTNKKLLDLEVCFLNFHPKIL